VSGEVPPRRIAVELTPGSAEERAIPEGRATTSAAASAITSADGRLIVDSSRIGVELLT